MEELLSYSPVIIFIYVIYLFIKKPTKRNFFRKNRRVPITCEKYNKNSAYYRRLRKGMKYEEQIAEYYRKQGYRVYEKGKEEGLDDGGIDLIAYKWKEMVLIQCKNWGKSRKLSQDDLRKFLGDCFIFLRRNQRKLNYKKVRRVFVCTNYEITKNAEVYVSKNSDVVEVKLIPFYI